MLYSFEGSDMSTQERLRESDRIWFDCVVPTIAQKYPGCWRSELGTRRDIENGIDYIYTEGSKEITVSARVWKSRPAPHFALRWRRTKYPENGLEIASRIDAMKRGEEISDLTMEGFLFLNTLYLAIIPTRALYTAIDGIVPFLSEFYVTNDPGDLTYFKRAPFDMFPTGSISKIIEPLRTVP